MARLLRLLAVLLFVSPAQADSYTDTIEVFRDAGDSGRFFDNCYGYAVFPTVGKGGFWIGGAYGQGKVYVGKPLQVKSRKELLSSVRPNQWKYLREDAGDLPEEYVPASEEAQAGQELVVLGSALGGD